MKQRDVNNANRALFIALGLINITIAVILTIIAEPPFGALIAVKMADSNLVLDEKVMDDLQLNSLLVELIVILKSTLFIIWYFYSGSYLKQRKVTDMFRLMKIFLSLIVLYISFTAFEVWMSISFVEALAS